MVAVKNKYGNPYEYSLFLMLRKRHVKSCINGSKKTVDILTTYGITSKDIEGHYDIHTSTKLNIELVEQEMQSKMVSIIKKLHETNEMSKEELIYMLKWFDKLYETKYKHNRANWKLVEQTIEELEEIEQSNKLKILVDHLYDDKITDEELEKLRILYYSSNIISHSSSETGRNS